MSRNSRSGKSGSESVAVAADITAAACAVGVAEIEDIVEKAVTAATKVIREEFVKLLTEIQSRVQLIEDRIDSVEMKLEQSVPERTGDLDDLRTSLLALRTEMREAAVIANDSEQYNRRLNVRINGLSIHEDEDCCKAVVDFVRQNVKIAIDENDIDVAHILPFKSTPGTVGQSVTADRKTSHQIIV